MAEFYNICIYVSLGVIGGFVVGLIKAKLSPKTYSQKQVEYTRNFIGKMTELLKYVTLMLLALGFIWCTYFLVWGIVMPQKAEYANNMAGLIVSILTVISILLAFSEFLKKRN